MDKIKVALIKCDNYELSEVKSAINRGIDLLGGIDLFIKEGDKILLKPNLLASESAEKSVTTHPVVFEAIISILQEVKEKKNIKKKFLWRFSWNWKRNFRSSKIGNKRGCRKTKY